MKFKKELFLFFISINLFSFLALFFVKNNFFINFINYQIAYFSFSFIIFCSYFSYKKNILKMSKNLKLEKKPYFIFIKKIDKNYKIIKYKVINDDFEDNFWGKIKRLGLFFNMLKFFAYMIFIFGFLYLQGKFLFDIFSYMWGILSTSLMIIIFIVFVRYEFKNNN